MSTNVYSKNDILQKLAQEGFFVDFLTLDSFLAKYKLEAIFEDEDGNEFFDISVYDTLVQNVLRRPPKEEVQQAYDTAETLCSVENDINNIEIIDDAPYIEPSESIETQIEESTPVQSQGLSDIKWHDWQEVSADLVKQEKSEPIGLVSIRDEQSVPAVEQLQVQNEDEPVLNLDEPEIIIDDEAQEQQYQDSEVIEAQIPEIHQEQQEAQDEEIIEEKSVTNVQEVSLKEPETINESESQMQEIMTTNEESEDDFDDIGLLSDSIQAQEKFQNYVVNELAKKNVDLTPKIENAFKLDISEKTLNMIARAIAKKIARQVSLIFSADAKNNTKLALIEKKNQELEEKLSALELQNKKLKLLLVESNKNLNSYKPTFFGLYKFVRNKNAKKKK